MIALSGFALPGTVLGIGYLLAFSARRSSSPAGS
jgi:ABC-type Fe3+ transport system permease subunit